MILCPKDSIELGNEKQPLHKRLYSVLSTSTPENIFEVAAFAIDTGQYRRTGITRALHGEFENVLSLCSQHLSPLAGPYIQASASTGGYQCIEITVNVNLKKML
jgi:hypothetical protein